jgi:hypothetical protein
MGINKLIDEENNGRDNKIINKIVRTYKLTPNKFRVGDTVYYTPITKGKVIEKYGFSYWDERCEKYGINPMTPIKIFAINKYKSDAPWWYQVEVEGTDKDLLWFIEDGLVPATPNYTPRKMDRTLESYSSDYDDFHQYDYRDIVIKVNNRDQLIELQDKLKNRFGLNNDLKDQILTYPNYIYINVNNCHSEGVTHIMYMCDRITEHEMNQYLYSDHEVNQYIFEISEWRLIENILLHGSKKLVPSYKPRKIDRTLEKRNSLEEATEICMYINNPDELNKLKEEVESLNIYNWSSMTFRIDEYPIYIFINLVTRDVSHVTERDMKRHFGTEIIMANSFIFDGVYNIPYKMKDINHFIKILQDRKITPLPLEVPSYRPRRIDRTLEANNKINEAQEITILIRSLEEWEVIEKILEETNYHIPVPFSNFMKRCPKPKNIFVNLISGQLSQTYMEYVSDFTKNSTYDYVWEKELTIDDLPLIKRILQTKKIISSFPSYAPRKINKINEELQNISNELKNCAFFQKYDSFAVISEKDDDKTKFISVIKLLEKIFKLKSPRIFSEDEKNAVYLAFRIKNNSYLDCGWGQLEDLDTFNDNNGFICRKFTVDEIDTEQKIKSALKYAGVIPTYKPRKIIKSIDESKKLDFSHIPSPILTPTQQQLRYKLGDTVIIRPDAFEYFSDVNEDMGNWLGKSGEIIYVTKASDIYENYEGVMSNDMNKDDLLLTLRLEGSEEDDDTYYWFYRCLVNLDFISPSYKPKFIDRSTDVNEQLIVEGQNMKNVMDSYYFSNYNSLIIIFDKRKLDKDEYYKIAELLQDATDIVDLQEEFNSALLGTSTYNFYVAIRLRDGYEKYMDASVDDMYHLEENNNHFHAKFPKLFTMSDVNTPKKINNLLKYGKSEPSYKPRNVNRTLEAEESFRNDYYINPEKYQEKFGKISPPIIPIEDIEKYYDVKFEDYCNDLYPQLNESPDWVSYFNNDDDFKKLNWESKGAYAFGYYKNKMYVSPESKGHGSMGSEEDRQHIMFDRTLFEFPGRIWTIEKLMSFWKYPNKEQFKKLIEDLSEVTKIDFSDPEWQIEILDKNGKSKNVPLSEYGGSKDVSREELIRQHVVSPLLKPKKEVPYGYGSRNPSYQPKRAWNMASLTAESSRWMGTPEDRRRMLKKGKYDCICLSYMDYREDEQVYEYFKELGIILQDLDRIIDHKHFVFLTKDAQNLKEFTIYTYSGINDIQSHMSNGWKPNIESVSPDMTFEEFKEYMEKTLFKSAKDMYTPRKMLKESSEDRFDVYKRELDKGRYLYIGTKNISEVYELYKILSKSKNVNMIFRPDVIEEWKTSENSNDIFYFAISKDADVLDFNVTELLGEMNYQEKMPQWFMDFTLDRGIIQRLFKIDMTPSYRPRKIDRSINESMDKEKGFAIYCENRQQYERIQKDLKEWGYIDSDGDYFEDDDLDNSLTYPITIMINAGDFDVFFTYVADPYSDFEEDETLSSPINQYESPNEFYEDREAVQLIKNKGVMIPNYTPRKINRMT